MIPFLWNGMTSPLVWFHWYGMVSLVWYDSLGMVWVSLVWHDSLGMVWFYWYGMILLVWYGFIGMVWFHWYGMLSSTMFYHSYGMIPLVWYPLVWYASISMVCFCLHGIIPFLWYDSIGMILNTYGIRKFWQSGRLVDPVQKSISMYVMEGSGWNIYCPSVTRASLELLLHRWVSVAFVHITVNVIDFLAILIDCMRGRILE